MVWNLVASATLVQWQVSDAMQSFTVRTLHANQQYTDLRGTHRAVTAPSKGLLFAALRGASRTFDPYGNTGGQLETVHSALTLWTMEVIFQLDLV